MSKRMHRSFLRLSTIALSALALLTGTQAMAQTAACNKDVPNYMTEFHDVSQSHYAADALKKLYDKGVVKGGGNNYFCATDPIKRIDAAVLIYRLKFEGKPDYKNPAPFTDISSITGEALEAVNTLYYKGVISGDGNTKFNPTDNLLRDAAASMLAKAYLTPSEISTLKTYTNIFTDVPNSEWYFEVIQAVSHKCIMSGTGNNQFSPETTINRINFAYALAHAHELVPRCATDQVCAEKLGKCAECDPDKFEQKCSDDIAKVQACSTEGSLVDTDCDNGCNDGKCNECKDDEVKCDDDKHMKCVNGVWKDDPCAANQECKENKCVDKPECEGSGYRCEGGDRQKCDNGKWTAAACETGKKCANQGECIDGPKCEGTETKCEGDKLKTCNNGEWQESTCPTNQICQGDKCIDKPTEIICEENKTRCDDTGVHQTCKNNAWTNTPCNQGETCVEGTCQPGDAPKCSNDQTKCDNDKHMKCVNGEWTEDPCTDGKVCKNDQCVDPEITTPGTDKCEENTYQCDANKIRQKCKDGAWINEPCDPELICEDGKCVDKPAEPSGCEENAVKCTGKGGRQICKDGKWVDKDCAEGLTCKNNDCVPASVSECKDDAEECDETGIHRICKDGKWVNDPCGDGMTCKDGTCTSTSSGGGDGDCSQSNGNAPIPLTVLLMLAGAGLLIRRRRHSA